MKIRARDVTLKGTIAFVEHTTYIRVQRADFFFRKTALLIDIQCLKRLIKAYKNKFFVN